MRHIAFRSVDKPQPQKKLDGYYITKENRDQLSKNLRSVHFTLGYDNNKNQIIRSHSQEQFCQEKAVGSPQQKSDFEKMQQHKNQVVKMIYQNNFSIKEVDNKKTRLQNETTNSSEFTLKIIKQSFQKKVDEIKKDLQLTHFRFGNEKANTERVRDKRMSVDNIDFCQMINEQHKRKEKMRTHHFVFGTNQNEQYRTSNEAITKNQIPQNTYKTIQSEKDQLKSQKSVNNTQVKNQLLTPNEKPNFHYTQFSVSGKIEQPFMNLKRSYLSLGNCQTERSSVTKSTYAPNAINKDTTIKNNQQIAKQSNYLRSTHFSMGNEEQKLRSTASESFIPKIKNAKESLLDMLTLKDLKKCSVDLKTDRPTTQEYSTTYNVSTQNRIIPQDFKTPSSKKIYKNVSHIFQLNQKAQIEVNSEMSSRFMTPQKFEISQSMDKRRMTIENWKHHFTLDQPFKIYQTQPQKQQTITSETLYKLQQEKQQVNNIKNYLKQEHYSFGNSIPPTGSIEAGLYTARNVLNLYNQFYQSGENSMKNDIYQQLTRCERSKEHMKQTNLILGNDKQQFSTLMKSSHIWIQPKLPL